MHQASSWSQLCRQELKQQTQAQPPHTMSQGIKVHDQCASTPPMRP
jgi:hypothetical protein